MIVALTIVAQLISANAALDKCRKLDKEFDTKNMPKPCQAAAEDTTLSIPERVEALRLLAFAHILNGDEALAEPAFLKMLVFSPTVDLPADAGPRFREIFAEVKKRFDSEGALKATYTAPNVDPDARVPVEIQIDVTDKLGRVVGARVRSVAGSAAPLEDRLVRSELGAGQLRFSGRVPEPTTSEAVTVNYQVLFDGWDGKELDVQPPVTGSFSRSGSSVVSAPADGEFPWLWVGVGSATAVVVAGATTGGLIYCFTAGPCKTQNAWVRVRVAQ